MQVKLANQTVVNNTPAVVAGLVVPIGRSSIIHVRYHFNFDDASVAGFVVEVAVPVGATITGDGNAWGYDGAGNLDTLTLNPGQASPVNGPGFVFQGGGGAQIWIGDTSALVVNGLTAGNISLTMRQLVTTPGNPVTMFVGAYVDWTVIK